MPAFDPQVAEFLEIARQAGRMPFQALPPSRPATTMPPAGMRYKRRHKTLRQFKTCKYPRQPARWRCGFTAAWAPTCRHPCLACCFYTVAAG